MAAVLASLTFALLLLQLVSGVKGNDTFSNYFRMVFIDNFVDCPVNRPVDLYVCNRALNDSIVNVSIPYIKHSKCPNISTSVLVAQSCTRIKLCEEIRHTYADGSLAKKVVEVSADTDISVQGFNVEKFSADSYVILPWHLSGLHHYILSYTLQSIQTQFAIVCKEYAKIRIVIPDRRGETITVDYNGLRYANGETLTFGLEPETSFLAQSAGDLTGVMIQSSRKVAVFSGNVRTYNDHNKASRDHLVEQVLPVSRWDKEFIYVPTPRQVPGDTVKIISSADNCKLELRDVAGTRELLIGRAPTVLSLSTMTYLLSTHPILVAVIVRSQNGKQAGLRDPADPSMYFIPSIDQYHSQYFLPKFNDAEDRDYAKVWVLMAVFLDYYSEVLVDGELLKDTAFLELGERLYMTGALQVNSSTMHRIEVPSRSMMAIGYGASDRESFASTLGYQFHTLDCEENEMLEVGDGVDNDCDGLIDEETCGDGVDNDHDSLLDEDCKEVSQSLEKTDATGTQFAIVFMSNIIQDADNPVGDQVEMYISPLDIGTTIKVSTPAYDGPNNPELEVQGSIGSVVQINLHQDMRVTPKDSKQLGVSTKTKKVIKIEANKNIILYGINKKRYSTDAFLALPTSAIGSEYYAYCNSPVNPRDDRCQFAAASIEDGTIIVIDVPAGVILDGIDGAPNIEGPEEVEVSLDSYEAIEIQSITDLTGVRVYSRGGKPFSFFSGNTRTKLPTARRSRDHLVEQLPPTNEWGTTFFCIPTPRERNESDIIKIIAKEDDTRVEYWYFNETQMFDLERGGHHDIKLKATSPITVKSTKPILVIQISKSAPPESKLNDPSALLIVPENHWSNNYYFVTPLSGYSDSAGYQLPFDNYIILAVRKKYRESMVFRSTEGAETIIGRDANWVEMPGEPDVEGLVFQLPEGHGQSSITNLIPEARWMALMFGKTNRETYGTPIGMRIGSPKLSDCVQRYRDEMKPGDNIDNDCDGRIDEEMSNNMDDDNDGLIDEDVGLPPSGYRYTMIFEENTVEYPRNYALEIYVGPMADTRVICRMQTPMKKTTPTYDITTAVHDPTTSKSDRIQFAASAALRATATNVAIGAISMTCNHPVTVMGINKETFSTDAFIVFEEQTLGTEYYTVSFSPATIQTQFAVVAVKEGTTNVQLLMKAEIIWGRDRMTSTNLQLKRFQAFQAQSEDDLTGSRITSDKPIAVFSGNVRTEVKLSASRDHLVSQLPPTSAWGTAFHILPATLRTVGDIFRVVAEEKTELMWRGNRQELSSAGDYMELEVNSTNAFLLTSTKPVMVMHIMKSQAGAYHEEPADPCFMLVTPVHQYLNMTAMVTPLYSRGFYKHVEHYNIHLTIVLLDGARNGILVNGKTVQDNPDVSFNPEDSRAIEGQTSYIAVGLTINKPGIGTYTITHQIKNIRFSGYLIGTADRESFCVGIGLNQPINN